MKTNKNEEQTLVEQGKVSIQLNINNNGTPAAVATPAPVVKKSSGGVVKGAIGGVLLGGAAVCYVGDVSAQDFEDKFNEIVDELRAKGILPSAPSQPASVDISNDDEDNVAVVVDEENQQTEAGENVIPKDGESVDVDVDVDVDGDDVIVEVEAEPTVLSGNNGLDIVIDGDVAVAESINDEMSFTEAFTTARAEVGPGSAFMWRGNIYGTYTAEEWNDMSAEEKAEFGSNFTYELSEDDDFDAAVNEDIEFSVDGVAVSQVVNDEMSFNDAFAAARAELGAGAVFEWRGNVYGTYFANEWESMSVEEKLEFADRVIYDSLYAEDEPLFEDADDQNVGEMPGAEIDIDPENDNDDNELIAEVDNDNIEVNEVADNNNTIVDVDVENVLHVSDAYGNEYSVAELSVDGESVTLMDTNNDGVMDVALNDANGDGVVQLAEIEYVSGDNITVDELTDQFVAANQIPEPSDDLFNSESFDCNDDVADDLMA